MNPSSIPSVRGMLQRIAPLVCAAALAGLAPGGQAAVLSFDDLPPGSLLAMPAAYAGFSFSDWFHSDFEYADTDAATPWSAYQPSSGVINLFTGFSDPSQPEAQVATVGPAISAGTPFVFEGAHVTGFTPVTFVLSLGGVEVHRSSTLAVMAGTDGTYAFLSSGYAGLVDAVAAEGVQGYYGLDDFTYSAAPIPEPGSGGLLALGLAVTVLAWRRHKAGAETT